MKTKEAISLTLFGTALIVLFGLLLVEMIPEPIENNHSHISNPIIFNE